LSAGVEYPAYWRARDPYRQRIREPSTHGLVSWGIMLTVPRPAPIRAPEEMFQVDRARHLDRRALDDPVLRRGDAHRPLPSIRLRDIAFLRVIEVIEIKAETIRGPLCRSASRRVQSRQPCRCATENRKLATSIPPISTTRHPTAQPERTLAEMKARPGFHGTDGFGLHSTAKDCRDLRRFYQGRICNERAFNRCRCPHF
jgi:hypothetical protein